MPPVLVERVPTEDDAAAIVAIVCASDVRDTGVPDYDLAELAGEWADPEVDVARDAVVVHEPGGPVLGYGMHAAGAGRIWVDPEHVGRGIGTRLADLVETRAAAAGRTSLSQHPAAGNAPGLALLAARGYVLVRRHGVLGVAVADAVPSGRVDPAVSVEPYDAADADAVQALLEAAFAPSGMRVRPLAMIAARGEPTTSWRVARVDGRLAGAVRADLRDGEGFISELGTDAAFRGRGIGHALLDAVIPALAARGVRRVELTARSDNPAALRLYERAGFTADWSFEEHAKALVPTPG